MKKFFTLLIMLLAMFSADAESEWFYQNIAAEGGVLAGETGYYLSGVYPDIMQWEMKTICTGSGQCSEVRYRAIGAIEVDFTSKYCEGLMQAALYAKLTDSRGKLLLVIDPEHSSMSASIGHIDKCIQLIEFYNLPIDLYLIDENLVVEEYYISPYATQYQYR